MQTNEDKAQRIEIILMILLFNSILLYFFHGSMDNPTKYNSDEEWVKVYVFYVQFNKVVYLFSGDTFLPRLF